jgi:hypothetical protein
MSRPTLDCPHAYYVERMRINCRKTGGLCAYQHYRSCKGWWANTPAAAHCLAREEVSEDEDETTG